MCCRSAANGTGRGRPSPEPTAQPQKRWNMWQLAHPRSLSVAASTPPKATSSMFYQAVLLWPGSTVLLLMHLCGQAGTGQKQHPLNNGVSRVMRCSPRTVPALWINKVLDHKIFNTFQGGCKHLVDMQAAACDALGPPRPAGHMCTAHQHSGACQSRAVDRRPVSSQAAMSSLQAAGPSCPVPPTAMHIRSE
jgi:hypothetical protein